MSLPNATSSTNRITIVGGGLAGLTAAITCAEGGARVSLLEARSALGGRARSSDGPYKANVGPHAFYKDGPLWQWMAERKLLPHHVGPPLAGFRLRWQGEIRRTPPLASIPAVLRLRGREAPDRPRLPHAGRPSTPTSAPRRCSRRAPACTPSTTTPARCRPRSSGRGRSGRCSPHRPQLATRSAAGARSCAPWRIAPAELGVRIETGCGVGELPETPTIVATELGEARELLGDDSLRWTSGHTVCLDLGLRHRRGDPFVVSDLDEAGWIERFTAPDPSLAPGGRGADPGADAGSSG